VDVDLVVDAEDAGACHVESSMCAALAGNTAGLLLVGQRRRGGREPVLPLHGEGVGAGRPVEALVCRDSGV